MSEEKVKRYKEEKANRKKIMKKQKRKHMLRIATYVLVACLVVGFMGWSVYDKFFREEPSTPIFTMSEEEWASFLEQYAATSSDTGTKPNNSDTEGGEEGNSDTENPDESNSNTENGSSGDTSGQNSDQNNNETEPEN